MNQRDNAKLKSSDNKKAQFTIFPNKWRTLHVHEISFCILCLDLLIIIFYLLRRANTSRSSQQRCSVKKGVLRNFAKFTGIVNACARVSFLIKLHATASSLVLMLRRLLFMCEINFKVKLLLLYEKQFLSALFFRNNSFFLSMKLITKSGTHEVQQVELKSQIKQNSNSYLLDFSCLFEIFH